MMANEEHVSELIPAYALDSLEEAETLQVSRHLAGCAACRAELHEYQSVVDLLGFAAPPAEPPQDLKARLMARVEGTRRPEPPRPGLWQQWAAFWRRSTPAWGLVSLMLFILLAAGNLWMWQQLSRQAAQPAALQVVNLVNTENAPQARGILVVSLDGEHGTLVVDNLPVLGPEHQYQLWLIDREEQRTSGGIFDVSEEGYGVLWISAPQPLVQYRGLGITIEPAGGSPGPTGHRVLGGDL